jgi:2-phospho-L-lactate guanylyltransferase (CobY/MobA/RfbA family)
VALGVGQLEQGGEGLETVGESGVPGCSHLGSVFHVPTIVIPFRGDEAKQRLPGAVRTRIARAMLADVTAAAGEIGRTIVTTARGLGAAVEEALTRVTETPVLIVNADLPAATPRDLLALLGSIPPQGLAVAAAADGTTNAIGLDTPSLFRPLYGPGSAERFLPLGPSRLVEIPHLAADVDTTEDLMQLEERLGPHTAAALAELAAPAR